MSVIRLNSLYHDVKVGCLYDYNDAKMLPEILNIASENIELLEYTDPLPVDITITTDVSEKARLACIGINKHLKRQLNAKMLEMNTERLWFDSYLKDEAFYNCDNNQVNIIAYLKFARRGERLLDDFVNSDDIWRYYGIDHGGTHLVQAIEYGAEFVLWMQHRPVDTSKETKRFLELTMQTELENYLEKLFKHQHESPLIHHNALFDTMSCSFESSIHDGYMSNRKFKQCIRKIQELVNTEENDRQNIWHPVGIELRRIPTITDIRTSIDLSEDMVFELRQMNQWITQRCKQLLTEIPFSHRVPFLKKALIDFRKLLEPMASEINEVVHELQHNYCSPSKNDSVRDRHKSLLSSAIRWLKRYHEDVEIIHSALEGNSLPVLDLRSIKDPVNEDQTVKRTKIFVLYFRCIATALDKRFKKWARNSLKGVEVFECEGSGDTELEEVSKEFQIFLNESLYHVDKDVDYAVGILSPNSPYKAGFVFTISHEEVLRVVNCTPSDVSSPNTPQLALPEGSKDTEEDWCRDDLSI